MQLLREALERARAGLPQALVTVIHSAGSTPRHAGARMLVDPDGAIRGTIGGGRVEMEAIAAGVEVANGAPATRAKHNLVRDLAMCCGGSMDLYIEPVAPSVDAIAAALSRWSARRPARLVTRLDGSPMQVEESATHGPREPRLAGDRFEETIWPGDRAILFGLGHVTRAIGPVLAGLGFEVVVCDDNQTGVLDADLPGWVARAVASFELGDVVRELGAIGAADYLLILTRDHAVDQRILEQALSHEALPELAYLGLIGSRGKVGRFHKRLVAKGIATPERWARLRSPIGLDIAAETPAEIAISVAAELIQMRHRRAAAHVHSPGQVAEPTG